MEIINTYYLSIISAAVIGLAAGYLGSFMVLRRMSLVGDALSHVALPGVALALLFHINGFLGAFGALFLGIVGIWLIERQTKLSTESLVGLFFTVSLALGLLITPEEELLEALFGDLTKVTQLDTILALALSGVVVGVMYKIARNVILGTISDDLAQASGIKTQTINFIFLLLIALIVALGIKVVGTLLMGALVVIPAITARNVADNLRSYTWGAAVIGLISATAGVIIAGIFGLAPGPVVVLTSGVLFLVSLLLKE